MRYKREERLKFLIFVLFFSDRMSNERGYIQVGVNPSERENVEKLLSGLAKINPIITGIYEVPRGGSPPELWVKAGGSLEDLYGLLDEKLSEKGINHVLTKSGFKPVEIKSKER